MGFRKPMDYNSVSHQIYIAGVELNSPRNDGFTQWEIKQDLYKVKFLVDQILKSSPEFVGETEFLDQHQKQLMWKELEK